MLDTTAVEVQVKRAMIAAADQVVLLGRRGEVSGQGHGTRVRPGRLDVVVTDASSERAGARGAERSRGRRSDTQERSG